MKAHINTIIMVFVPACQPSERWQGWFHEQIGGWDRSCGVPDPWSLGRTWWTSGQRTRPIPTHQWVQYIQWCLIYRAECLIYTEEMARQLIVLLYTCTEGHSDFDLFRNLICFRWFGLGLWPPCIKYRYQCPLWELKHFFHFVFFQTF
jgi:hypothetical protein